jgi:hypothetical protein
MAEKTDYDISAGSPEHSSHGHGGVRDIVNEKGASTAEAADIYGGMSDMAAVILG